MPATVKGAAYTFAIPANEVSVTGMVIESATLSSSAQIDEEGIDNLGLVAAYAHGGEQYEVQASGIYTGAGPSVNGTLSVGGLSMVITRVETSWGNRDWKKATVTAKGYENVT